MSDQNVPETAQTGKPLCYSDRPTWKESDRYMFVSYAHLDSDAVYADLDALYAKCLNYWYDKKLKAGDMWDESVAALIRSEQCCGIILYLGVNTVKSAAVEQELKIYREILASGRKFLLIPVSLSGGNVNSVVRAAYSDPKLAGLSEKEFDQNLPQERAANVLTTIPSNMLYIPRSSSDLSHVDRIVEELQKHEADVFCDNDSSLDKLSRLACVSVRDGVAHFAFGTYPQNECDAGSKCKITRNGNAFFANSPLAWRVDKLNETTFTAVTEYAIDCVPFAGIEDYLKDFADACSLSEEERACVLRCSLCDINTESLPFTAETAYCRAYGRRGFIPLYWAQKENAEKEKVVTAYAVSRDNKLSVPTQAVDKYTCALRVCIELDIDKFIKVMS